MAKEGTTIVRVQDPETGQQWQCSAHSRTGPPLKVYKSISEQVYIWCFQTPTTWQACLKLSSTDRKLSDLTIIDVQLQFNQPTHVAQSPESSDTYGDVYDDSDY